MVASDTIPANARPARAGASRVRSVVKATVGAVVLLGAVVVHVPALLAFPYRARLGETTILSDRPIDPAIGRVIARADRLLAASPIDIPGIPRQIVLTDGGWRWRLLSLTSHRAFALRRPFGRSLVFNRSDVARDLVFRRMEVANRRSLSGTIAHETAHMLIAWHLGEVRAALVPTWKIEGYADHVAAESSLRDEDVARLRAVDPGAKALVYHRARRRVAAELARNGGSVDALFH